jgi:hypothetical protein
MSSTSISTPRSRPAFLETPRTVPWIGLLGRTMTVYLAQLLGNPEECSSMRSITSICEMGGYQIPWSMAQSTYIRKVILQRAIRLGLQIRYVDPFDTLLLRLSISQLPYPFRSGDLKKSMVKDARFDTSTSPAQRVRTFRPV